jgi:hypothetical protein
MLHALQCGCTMQSASCFRRIIPAKEMDSGELDMPISLDDLREHTPTEGCGTIRVDEPVDDGYGEPDEWLAGLREEMRRRRDG